MRISMFMVMMLWTGATFADVTVKSVTAQQRYPWNGLVDIAVTIQGASNEVAMSYCMFVASNAATQAVLPVTEIKRHGKDTASGTTWVRRYVWNATADIGAIKVEDLVLTIDVSVGVQLWENGPYWAECNVGATKPEDCGYYFWWGDTVGYKRNAANNGWVSVKDGTSFSFDLCPTYGKDNFQLRSAGYIDSTGNLVAAHDAATAHLGAPWRMPTNAEMGALISNCDITWTTRGGVYGRLVAGRGAYSSKSIFLPAAGYGYGSSLYDAGSYGNCWSSTPSSDISYGAWSLYFASGYFDRGGYHRYGGQSVRPLRGFAK